MHKFGSRLSELQLLTVIKHSIRDQYAITALPVWSMRYWGLFRNRHLKDPGDEFFVQLDQQAVIDAHNLRQVCIFVIVRNVPVGFNKVVDLPCSKSLTWQTRTPAGEVSQSY